MKKIKFNVDKNKLCINDRIVIDEKGVFGAYPIGSIYISINNISPAEVFGGTWSKIENRFLLASGSKYEIGSEGGECSHVLTVHEMPSHSHSLLYEYGENPEVKWFSTNFNHSGNIAFNLGMEDRNYGHVRISNTGNSQAHNNMPPYLVVNIWQRIG